MKFSIIIPIYNERATAAALIEAVMLVKLPNIEKEIIIVEGASTDGTHEIVHEHKSPELWVIDEDRPRGKGAAVRTGLAQVTGEVVLIQDGDLEYSVDDYGKVLEPIQSGRADMVLGSRTMTSPQHWQFRRFSGFEKFYGFFVNLGGVLFTGLFNLLYGTHLTDGATMFKVFRADKLKAITLRSNGFDYDWEIIAKLVKNGCRIAEVPVRYKARSRAEGKKIRFWRDGIRVFKAIVRYRFCN